MTFALIATTMIASSAFARTTKYYDEQGRLEKLSRDNGTTYQYYEYDSQGRITNENKITYDDGRTSHSDITKTYDSYGNMTGYTSKGYYDPNAPYTDDAYRFDYTYDDNGNILTRDIYKKNNDTWEVAPYNGVNSDMIHEVYTYTDGVLTGFVGESPNRSVQKTYVNGILSESVEITDSTWTKKIYDAQGYILEKQACYSSSTACDTPDILTFDHENHTATQCMGEYCWEPSEYYYDNNIGDIKVYDAYGNLIADQYSQSIYANPAWKTASNNTNTQTKTPKRIYTLKEANDAAKPTGNRVSITYK